MQSNMSNRLHLFFKDLAADPISNSDVHVLDIVDTNKHEDTQNSIWSICASQEHLYNYFWLP